MTFGNARNPRSTLDHAHLFSLDFIVSQQYSAELRAQKDRVSIRGEVLS